MLANRVREYTLTTGTGDVTLAGAMAAHIRFSDAFAAGDSLTYVIEDGDNYEIGTGILMDAATLQRTTVGETLVDGVYDKDAPAAISLSGSARVYCAATADFLLDPTEAADVIREVTPDAGVTVDGVVLKDGGGLFTSNVSFQKLVTDAFGMRGVDDADSPVFGSGSTAYGANIQMHGPSAFAAGDMSLRNGSTPWMYYDGSVQHVTVDAVLKAGLGGQSITLLPGAADHTYLGFNARTATPGTRSGFIGYSSTGTSQMFFANELSGPQTFSTNGNTWLQGNSDGSAIFYGSLLANAVSVVADTNYDDVIIGQTDGNHGLTIKSSPTGVSGLAFADSNTTGVAGRAGLYQYRHAEQQHRWLVDDSLLASLSPTAMTINPDLNVGGSVRLDNGQAINWLDSGGSARNGIVWDASNNMSLYSGQSNAIWLTGNSDGSATFAGQMLATLGSAALPAYTFGNDNNTGVFSAADNVIGFSAAGVSQMTVATGGVSIVNALSVSGSVTLPLLQGDLTTGALDLYGGPGLTGANILLYAASHSTQPNDILFRTGGTTRMSWDESGNIWSFFNNNINGVPSISRGNSSVQLILSGGLNTDLGANLVLYGESQPSQANDILFRTGTTGRLRWDDDAGRWDFQGLDVIGLRDITLNNGNILRNHDANFLTVHGGNTTNAGGSVRIYGPTHPTNPSEVHIRSGAANILAYASATSIWDMTGRLNVSDISGLDNIFQSNATSSLSASGGSSFDLGANVQLFGESHDTNPNDILFRVGTGTKMQWTNIENYWSFAGNQITSVPLITRGSAGGTLELGGGSAASGSGANILLYGPSHATKPFDIEFRAGAGVELHYDHSASVWNFSLNSILTSSTVGADGAAFRCFADDSEYILQSYNASAGNAAQFHIRHDLGDVVFQNTRGDLRLDNSVTIDHHLNVGGIVSHGTPTELTISLGSITISKSFHRVDTEGDASTDDLETINGGSAGDRLVLYCVDGARSVTLIDSISGAANLQLAGNCTLNNPGDTIELIFDGTNWLELSRSNNS